MLHAIYLTRTQQQALMHHPGRGLDKGSGLLVEWLCGGEKAWMHTSWTEALTL